MNTGSDVSISLGSALNPSHQIFSDYLMVSVNDTGIGMREDVIKGLFELFGNSKMKYPEPESDEERSANRRVEIKIK